MQRLAVSSARCVPLRPSPTRRSLRRLHKTRVTFPDAAFDPAALEESEGIRAEEFLREFDSLLDGADYAFQVGQRIEGYVFDVDESGAFVDIGGKEMGFCSNQYLALTKVPRPIDIIQPNTRRAFDIAAVGVKSKKLGGEVTLLSRTEIVREIALKRLRQMSEFQIKLKVHVLKKNMGGYVVVDEMGVPAFLPGRHALIFRPGALDDDPLIGKTITVKILDLFDESKRYLVTQRGVLDPQIEESRFALGSVLEGTVEGVMLYGVFVNIGGISGLLHTSQISKAPVQDAASVFTEGDRVKVMVLGYDRGRGRVSLSTSKIEPVAGDMLKDPQKVYDRAEEMAAKFMKELEEKAADVNREEVAPVTGDVTVNTSRLG